MTEINFKEFITYGGEKAWVVLKHVGMGLGVLLALTLIPTILYFSFEQPQGYDYTITEIKEVEFEGNLVSVYYVEGEGRWLTEFFGGEPVVEERYIRETDEKGRTRRWIEVPSLERYYDGGTARALSAAYNSLAGIELDKKLELIEGTD